MVWASIGFGAASAVAWLAASLVTPAWTPPRWDGPTDREKSRLTWGSRLNAAGAFLASFAMAFQAWALLAQQT